MEAPSWNDFAAVDALAERCGSSAGVSAWAGGATRCATASMPEPQVDSTDVNTATGMDLSLSALYWINQDTSCTAGITRTGNRELNRSYVEGGCDPQPDRTTPPLRHGTPGNAGGGAVRPMLSQTCACISNVHEDERSQLANPSTVATAHTGMCDLRYKAHHSLIVRDLSLRHFEDWKSRTCSVVSPSANERYTGVEGLADPCSEHPMASETDGVRYPEATRPAVSGDRCKLIHKEDPMPLRQERSAKTPQQGRSAGNCALNSPDHQRAWFASIPPIASLSDLSRGLIPALPHLYSATFPEFDAVSTLFWKFQYMRAKQPSAAAVRQRKPEQDAMLIESCLDHAIVSCETWCAAHGVHGVVHEESVVGPSSQGQTCNSSNSAVALDKHRKNKSQCLDLTKVAVPGWVPQVSTVLTHQRWYCIVAGKDHPEVTEIVGTCLKALGWNEDESCKRMAMKGNAASVEETTHMWNLCWTWSVRARVPDALFTWQRINHFQECRHLTRKDLLKHHLQRHAAMFENSRHVAFFQCMPTTFTLPREYEAFEQAYRHVSTPAKSVPTGGHIKHVEVLPEQIHGLNLWILKPSSLSRGRGIYLLDDLGNVACSQSSVVQRYVADPYIYRGLKFDLRLYVLVTSFHPLEAFLYREGFARFALVPYTTAAHQRSNNAVHLTNSAIQAEDAQIEQNLPNFLKPSHRHSAGGSKMSLSRLWPLLREEGVDERHLWKAIRATVLAALYSAKDSIPHQVNAFELYGFDIIFDQQMKVWLLEVNSSPSLGVGTELDRQVKGKLIKDVIKLVDPLPFDRLALAHVLKRRKHQRTGPARKSRRQGGGLLAGTEAEEREVLNADLYAVLKGARIRAVGDMPVEAGNFERVAPCSLLEQFERMQRI
eukprot:jgi/Ulvmu1/12004/UM083_0017.1